MQVLTVRGLPLPATLDYKFLGRAVETVATSDLALQTAKCLWFLYKRMELLSTHKSLYKLLITIVAQQNFVQ